MRRTTLLALLAAAAVAGWIALFEREDGAEDEGRPVFGLNETEILAVEIGRPGEPTVHLTRDGKGFVVAEGDGPGSPAADPEVDLLLQNIGSLRFGREIEAVADGAWAEFGLAPPELSIRVIPETEPAAPLTAGFGDETPAAGNRYLRVGDRLLVVSAFARDNFDLSAWDLRDKRVFRLDAPAARRLRLATDDGTTVEIARQQGAWNILRPYRFAADPYETSQFAARLLDAEMAGLAPDPDEAEDDPFGLGSPRLRADLDLVVGPQEEALSSTIHFGGESRTPPGVFARLEPDPLVFVVGKPFFESLREAAATEMAGLRSLDLFRFAGFQAVTLRVQGPEGETLFRRRDGEEGREWTLEAGGAPPVVVDTVAVEDLVYRLNSTEAEDLADETLPDTGAAWSIAVTETSDDGAPPIEPETVRFSVSATGRVRALRAGDERTLTLAVGAWEELAALYAAAQQPAEAS